MTHLHLDFETRSTVDLKKAGADVYARHPSTDVWCMAWAIGDGPVRIWTPNDEDDTPTFAAVTEWILGGGTVIAHNAAFELAIWNHVMVPRYGWPPLKAEQCVCTMAMSYAMAIPASLEKASAAMGIDQQKDMAGSRVMMQLARPRKGPDPMCGYCAGSGVLRFKDGTTERCGCLEWWTPEDAPEKFERLHMYCRQDVEVERELYKRLRTLSPQEQNLWHLDQRINQRGIAVDLKAVDAAIAMADAERKRLDKEMRKVTGNAVASCSAVSQLTDWLRWQGVDVTGVAKADVLELLDGELPDACRTALLLRQEAAKSSTKKLEAMRHGVCDDGRIRGLFQYHGASTGRWAGRRIQVHNLPRPKLSQTDIDQVFDILGGVECT